jgi:hypothetical protein
MKKGRPSKSEIKEAKKLLDRRQQCLDSFCEKLVKRGVDEKWVRLVADGMLARLRSRCCELLTDILESKESIDDLLEWNGRCSVRGMLYESGLVGMTRQRQFFLRGLASDISRLVHQRWGNRDFAGLEIAKKRAGWGMPFTIETAPHETEYDLFGQRVRHDRTKIPPQSSPGYKEFVAHWFLHYEEQYGRDYLWIGKDGRNLKRLIANTDFEQLKLAAVRYLRCRDPFYIGHPFDFFVSKINRWLVAGSVQKAGRDGEGFLREERTARKV